MVNVSVLIGTYNRCERLRGTLQALKAQRLDAGMAPELVVVDNRSTDATRAVVEEEGARAPWPVRYVYEPMQGLCAARNRAIHEARGRWLAFIDDDVRPDQEWLRMIVRAFQQWNAEGVCGRVLPIWEVEGVKPSSMTTCRGGVPFNPAPGAISPTFHVNTPVVLLKSTFSDAGR